MATHTAVRIAASAIPVTVTSALKILVRLLWPRDEAIPVTGFGTMLKGIALAVWIVIRPLPHDTAQAGPIRVVASNEVYADIARQIGGAAVIVSIANGRRDQASIITTESIILCGWAQADDALRDAARRALTGPTLIELPRRASDDSIYVVVPWYDTESMYALARAYADKLMRIRPDLAVQFAGNLAGVRVGFDAIVRTIGKIAKDYANSEVIVADPLSRGVANKLGFQAAGPSSANDSAGAISAKSVNDLKRDIERREGSIFLYNRDVANPEMKKLVLIAKQNGVPVAGLQEKLPTALRYQQWVLRQWNMVHGALNEAAQ
jgi:zinc/manganese transport system substrate-binding protein